MITRKMNGLPLIALLVVGVAVVVLPLLWVITTALTPSNEPIGSGLFPLHPSTENFRAIFSAGASYPVFSWLVNSIFVSASAAILVMLIDSLAAFALARLQFIGRQVIFYITLSSLVVPFIATLVPLYLEFAQLNLLDTYWALILPYSGNAFGVFLLYQFFQAIPKELEEVAVLDGATKFKLWGRIFLPLSIPITVTLGLLTFMAVYNDFFWPLVATTSPPMRTITVGIQIVTVSAFQTNYRLLMAITLVSVVPMIIAFVAAQRRLVEGIALTGLNG